jgi:hypothetical protein
MKINTILLFLTLPSLLLGASTASAANFPNFTINAASIEGANIPAFVADKITGNYDEFATFDSTNNTFSLSLKWEAGQFVQNDGATALNAKTTGLGTDYSVYALYQASGTFLSNSGVTTFTFLKGNVDMYLDKNLDTVFNDPIPKNGEFLFTTNITTIGDDVKIATGGNKFVNGQGKLDSLLPTCSDNALNCGSFGASSNFELTQAGTQFFSSPNPLYTAFISGQFNSFQLSSTQHINGSMDIVLHPVPLPAAAWMFISSMMALLAINKRKPIGNI